MLICEKRVIWKENIQHARNPFFDLAPYLLCAWFACNVDVGLFRWVNFWLVNWTPFFDAVKDVIAESLKPLIELLLLEGVIALCIITFFSAGN